MELDDNKKEVYKLTIVDNPNIIQAYSVSQSILTMCTWTCLKMRLLI